jgi:hypothetical protein
MSQVVHRPSSLYTITNSQRNEKHLTNSNGVVGPLRVNQTKTHTHTHTHSHSKVPKQHSTSSSLPNVLFLKIDTWTLPSLPSLPSLMGYIGPRWGHGIQMEGRKKGGRGWGGSFF